MTRAGKPHPLTLSPRAGREPRERTEVASERTVKHVRILPGDRVELRPENPKYPTVTYPLREVQILGKVVALIRKEG